MKKIFASAVVCERILNEIDGVASAIRIADVFTLRMADSNQIHETPVIPISLLVSIRVVEYDDRDHFTQVVMIRPDGEETPFSEPMASKIIQRVSTVPGGLNFAIQVGVIAKQWGLHRIKVLFDGEEVAEAIFTLLRGEDASIPERSPSLIEQESA